MVILLSESTLVNVALLDPRRPRNCHLLALIDRIAPHGRTLRRDIGKVSSYSTLPARKFRESKASLRRSTGSGILLFPQITKRLQSIVRKLLIIFSLRHMRSFKYRVRSGRDASLEKKSSSTESIGHPIAGESYWNSKARFRSTTWRLGRCAS